MILATGPVFVQGVYKSPSRCLTSAKRAGTIFSQNYDPVSTKQWCFCTVICEARPPTCYSCAFRHEIWTKPFGEIEDLSTADVKLLFEKWSKWKNFEDFVTLFFSNRERQIIKTKQCRQTEFLPPRVSSVSWHLALWQRANAKWWPKRPESMGTSSNGKKNRSVSHTRRCCETKANAASLPKIN